MKTRCLAAALAVLAACGPAEENAVRAVRRYNAALIEAYRAGDARLVERFAGPREAKKLLGLIGAKLDMGLTLDAELVELVPLRIERHRDGARVWTRERWRYADRRVGSGRPVGDASEDQYQMIYTVGFENGRWVVEEVRFAERPLVGRGRVSNSARAEAFHGSTTEEPQ